MSSGADSRTVIGDLHPDHLEISVEYGRNAQPAVALHRLHGVVEQVGERPSHLIRVELQRGYVSGQPAP